MDATTYNSSESKENCAQQNFMYAMPLWMPVMPSNQVRNKCIKLIFKNEFI